MTSFYLPCAPLTVLLSTTLSSNPLTRLKQKLRANLYSLGDISSGLRSALDRIAAPRDTTSGSSSSLAGSQLAIDIKTALGLPQTLSPEAAGSSIG